ncbi:universal stress protein [Sphingomonas edaphi]|uniref:Universal stress protein n=1 Tax=Sphingomonas edaphi TaxID=2315689 RepID=A0A418PZR8_9SPHN|nr:universal stress protein [Sphingomonas edaphi]RIX29235.1 universal stress protein [Sphingomonas edaphi]
MATIDSLERPSTHFGKGVAGPKSILLHVQNGKSMERRLETALSIARSSSAHLTCVHVTPVEAYVAFDSFGGVFVMNDVIKSIDEEEQALRESMEGQLRAEDVSWDYQQITGNIPFQLVRQAALADLIVTGREPHRTDFAGPAIGMMGDLLNRSRTPIFIPADEGAICDPNGPVLIGWNGSYESANAVRASLDMLKLARSVHVLGVQEEQAGQAFPDTRLLEYLSRHGVHAELLTEAGQDARAPDFVASAIIATAQDLGASYVVMGGYSHSRLGEYFFGGVTRYLLSASPVSLLMSH